MAITTSSGINNRKVATDGSGVTCITVDNDVTDKQMVAAKWEISHC